MKMSDSIAQLAEALAKAQGQIDDASKGSKNPFFNSKYADLAAVRAVIREPLAVNDIAVIQFPRSLDGEVEVETMLTHKSGEFISETLRLPVGKWDAHGIGSAITYARRYGLMSLLGIATDDDDGNAAVEKANPKVNLTMTGGGSLQDDARKAAQKGSAELNKFWKNCNEVERNLISADLRKELKEIAAAFDAKDAA